MVTCTKPPDCCNEDFVTAFETEEGPRVLSWSRGRQRGGQPQRVDVSPTLAVPRRGGGAGSNGWSGGIQARRTSTKRLPVRFAAGVARRQGSSAAGLSLRASPR